MDPNEEYESRFGFRNEPELNEAAQSSRIAALEAERDRLQAELAEANRALASVHVCLEKADQEAIALTRLLEEQRVRTLGVIETERDACAKIADVHYEIATKRRDATIIGIGARVFAAEANAAAWIARQIRARALATELEAGK